MPLVRDFPTAPTAMTSSILARWHIIVSRAALRRPFRCAFTLLLWTFALNKFGSRNRCSLLERVFKVGGVHRIACDVAESAHLDHDRATTVATTSRLLPPPLLRCLRLFSLLLLLPLLSLLGPELRLLVASEAICYSHLLLYDGLRADPLDGAGFLFSHHGSRARPRASLARRDLVESH